MYVDDRLVEMKKTNTQHSEVPLVVRVREIVRSWEDVKHISSERAKVWESLCGHGSIVWSWWESPSPLQMPKAMSKVSISLEDINR